MIQAFHRIPRQPRVSSIDGSGSELVGGHLQGLAVLDDRTLFLSASGERHATVLRISWESLLGTGPGSVTEQLTVGSDPLRHPGGIQIADSVLAVGIEDDVSRAESKIVFLDVDPVAHATPLTHLEFSRRASLSDTGAGRWTAGAVGLTRRNSHFLLVVGSWHSATLDFYLSTTGDLRDPKTRFEHRATWEASRSNRTTWLDTNWESYQCLWVSFCGGRTHLLGSHRNGGGEDWLDLYRVDLGAGSEQLITKVGKRHLACRGATFKHAGGFFLAAGSDVGAIATQRTLATDTALNVFAPVRHAQGADIT